MKVATRITVATAVVVALASAVYAYFDLSRLRREREEQLQSEARAVAATLRPIIEPQVSPLHPPTDAEQRKFAGKSGWTVYVIPKVKAPAELTPGLGEREKTELGWLRVMLEDPNYTNAATFGNLYTYAIALRAPGTPEEKPAVIGLLAISKPAVVMQSADVFRVLALVAFLVAGITLMVGLLAARLFSRPIRKLLQGIDDVAKGDLSHVILAERDDEIGQIATRFNEMTFSLRESRAETQRQNEAKLALEQRLGQTEKLATIGQLAAEIAHEVGTPLNVIAGRARSIQRKAKDADAVEKNAAIVAEQTARITRIIQRLLDFARRKVGTLGKSEVNLNELSLTTMELLAGQFSAAKVRTRLERAEGLPRVAGDADRLQQVLINLLLNAVQAMPDGGSVSVETGTVRRSRPGLEGSKEQSFVSVSVKDTGIGVPDEIREKIFDPFYTTKEGHGGTGLGLAVCSGIVKEHDGWIDIESNEGGGTVFRVYLPA